MLRQLRIYFDFRDWWIGYYRGDEHNYICPLPTVVIRWNRKFKYKCTPINPEISKIIAEVYEQQVHEHLKRAEDNFIKMRPQVIEFPITKSKIAPGESVEFPLYGRHPFAPPKDKEE